LFASSVEDSKVEPIEDRKMVALFAYGVPAMWPLSVILIFWAAIAEQIELRRASKMVDIFRSIGDDYKRVAELPNKELHWLYKNMKKQHSPPPKDNMFSAVEKTILDREVEKHILEHTDG